MIAFLRLMVMGFIALSVVYLCLGFWSRSVRRRKLNEEWDEEGHTGDRDAFIREGLRDYDTSLRPKLLLGVYIIPMIVIAVIIYLTNFA